MPIYKPRKMTNTNLFTAMNQKAKKQVTDETNLPAGPEKYQRQRKIKREVKIIANQSDARYLSLT